MAQKKEKTILSKNNPEKRLLRVLKKTGGKNNTGRITVRHKGGGVKQKYRIIDFGQKKLNQTGKVLSLEYDPNRTCYIALLQYNDGQKAYVLAPDGLSKEDEIICSQKAPVKIGNRMLLKNVPIGAFVHNIELFPMAGGKLARSAGSSVVVMGHEGKYTQIKMPSSEIRKVLSECFASIGQLSNPEHRFSQIGSAGRARKMGIRPTVRGSAMNACDHPHGGGKNKQPIGRHPRTAWGKVALGVKTRNKKKWTSKLIVQRRIKKKRK
ncbi:MAG: 50S ribosomal protein L2 [Candidatus Pacebacteria bacterium]|nr:50S ribosomal protein L2 [Candidatus Paceibacterota bacterium]